MARLCVLSHPHHSPGIQPAAVVRYVFLLLSYILIDEWKHAPCCNCVSCVARYVNFRAFWTWPLETLAGNVGYVGGRVKGQTQWCLSSSNYCAVVIKYHQHDSYTIRLLCHFWLSLCLVISVHLGMATSLLLPNGDDQVLQRLHLMSL